MKQSIYHHPLPTLRRRMSKGFAERLVERLGLDGALWACQENHWIGLKQEIDARYGRKG